MKKLVLPFFLLFISLGLSGQSITESNLVKAMHSISSHDLLEYVKLQIDDKYAGRLTGTEEYRECAEWLADFYEEIGLQPAYEDSNWFQWFDIPYTLIHPECGVTLHVTGTKGETILKHYDYVNEFMPGSTSASGEVTAEVVYAGYGITAPELGYDDYMGIDVEGKIILIEREAPVSPGAGPEKFNPWFRYSFHQYKLENAVKHGAAGMIYNYGPIANPNNAYNKNFIYVHVGDSVVKDIFSGTGRNHRDVIRGINNDLKPGSFETGKTVTVKMTTTHVPDGRGMNIIGLLPGTDPVLKEEVIIIGAHLDHMGRCYDIIPGANDNASAVAVMIGVAKALAESKLELKRTIAFIAFGAEEQALVGSRKYVDEPLFPLNKTVLLNMDGVGVGDKISVNAGNDFPLLYSPFEEFNNKYIHRQINANSFPNLGRPRLDAAIFLKAGVPSLSLSTFGSQSYYHIPPDNIEIIKPEIMEDLAQLLLGAVVDLANAEEKIR
ncbi:MAG TPA: M20/M25/M40 family metallo-hydrolase [Bacteroidales bacterium]|nr:M20/M25/M40 family metallo-hydrolase [Bacteroidales bacterium]